MIYLCSAKVAMLIYTLCQNIYAVSINHSDIILGALSNRLTHVLGSINVSLSKQIQSRSKTYSVQKLVGMPNTIDLRAKLDVLSKIHFIEHNRSHQVRPIGLRKPKYQRKEFQEFKVV